MESEFIDNSRSAELRMLDRMFSNDGPNIIGLYGIAGVGKSSLVKRFAEHHKDTCMTIDCQTVEPTPGAFINKLKTLIHCDSEDLAAIKSALNPGALLILDQFESFTLIESWLRTEFVPEMNGKLKLILSGRLHPDNQWVIDPSAGSRYCSLKLSCLPFTYAVAFLESQGLSKVQAMGINQFAHGHPVALKLASATMFEQPERQLYQVPPGDVIQTLVQFFVEDIQQPELRRALEAASIVRRVSESLLTAMLKVDAATAACVYAGLEDIELVDSREDGLVLHEVLRSVLSSSLKARSPGQYAEYRRCATQVLLNEVKLASAGQLWRYTADILYLVDNSVIRNAFFPPDDLREFSVLPAQDEDKPEVMRIIAAHEPGATLDIYSRWWDRQLNTFHCVKNYSNETVGFYCLIKPADVPRELLYADPVTAAWMDNISESQKEGQSQGQSVFIRRWLSKNDGESLCGVQAACWLDIKRTYLEMRPQLRKVYLTLNNLQPYAGVATELGFQVLESVTEIDKARYFSAVLDMGPDSVDGWISTRLLQEIKQESEHNAPPVWFDVQARQLCLNEQRIDLTPLEFGTLDLLVKNHGIAIERKRLLKEVWGIEYEGSSNVVDTIVLSLRKKLQEKSGVIHSVRGMGYRYEEEG